MDVSLHSQKLLVGSIYRPPDYANFFIEFPVLMEGIWRRRTNIVLLGDFNVNLLDQRTDYINRSRRVKGALSLESSPRMLLSFATCTCSAQFFDARNNIA